MRGKGITLKQRKYAYNIMNIDTTKKEAMLQAGYSEHMSNKPSVVERSTGFQLAMASVFAETGNIAMQLVKELGTRDMSAESTKDIVQFFDVMTKAMERMTPKTMKPLENDEGLRSIFVSFVNKDTDNGDVIVIPNDNIDVDNSHDLTDTVIDDVTDVNVDNQ